MESFFDERAERFAREKSRDARDQAAIAWFNRDQAPEVRLLKFEVWTRRQLCNRLDWEWAGAAKEKRIEQCRLQLKTVCLHLFKRGWMFDGPRLAVRITTLLDAVAKYQRAGGVIDFWAYYKSAVDRYVGANSEELRDEAIQSGVHVGHVFAQLTRNLPAGPSITELVAQQQDETLRAKLSRQRAKDARAQGDKAQTELF